MKITGSTRIGDIATLVPVSIPVFERYGVDFYRNGERPLVEALTETGLSVGDILAEIERAVQAREEEHHLHAEWARTEPGTLADHIRENHHGFLETQLPRVAAELSKVLLAWGDSFDELFEIARGFERLRRMLEAHVVEEEQNVFPLLRELGGETRGKDRAAARLSVDERRDLGERLARLEAEHADALEGLRTMRSDAADYRVDGGCPECAELFAALTALEADVQRHIQLEGDVLLPTIRRLAGL